MKGDPILGFYDFIFCVTEITQSDLIYILKCEKNHNQYVDIIGIFLIFYWNLETLGEYINVLSNSTYLLVFYYLG